MLKRFEDQKITVEEFKKEVEKFVADNAAEKACSILCL